MPRARFTGPAALLLSFVLSACSSASEGTADDVETCATACDAEGGSDDGAVDSTTAQHDDDADGSDDGSAPETSSGIPCEIERILDDNCGGCHDDPPLYGAPMALVEHDDFQVPAPSDVTRSVWEMAIDRMDDPVAPMPPGGQMDEDDKHTLLAWLEQGAPEDDETCEDGPDEPGEPVGPDALPCEVSHTFTAHASGSAEPFHVPEQGADNLYQCFTFKSPLAAGTQATAWAPIIDDERVVHHWILYRTPTPQVDGGVGPCDMPSDAKFVAGWAPGGKNFLMPDDVGLELAGPEDYFILQLHYHNTASYADSYDASGVAFCTAEQPRPQTAGVITLGTVWLNIPAGAEGHEETGVCPSWITNFMPQPLNVIASFPHMHELGRSFTTEILRGGSEADVDPITEVPIYNFENQEFYVNDPTVQIMPGDAIRTTCTYDNPYDFTVRFGEATEDEMCFNFVMAYPIEMVGDYRDCGTLDNG